MGTVCRNKRQVQHQEAMACTSMENDFKQKNDILMKTVQNFRSSCRKNKIILSKAECFGQLLQMLIVHCVG